MAAKKAGTGGRQVGYRPPASLEGDTLTASPRAKATSRATERLYVLIKCLPLG